MRLRPGCCTGPVVMRAAIAALVAAMALGLGSCQSTTHCNGSVHTTRLTLW